MIRPHHIILLTLLILTTASIAQTQETGTEPVGMDSISSIHTAQWIWQPAVPATMVSVSVAGLFSPWMKEQNVRLRDAVQEANGGHRCHIDDGIIYLPAASVYGLKLCGLESKHDYLQLTHILGQSYLIGGGITLCCKELIDIRRPDGRALNSYPSGHTMTAFVGAEVLRKEYGEEYPAIAVAGYTVAIATAMLRIYNNRHWLNDVVAGAGLGILSVQLTYALSKK